MMALPTIHNAPVVNFVLVSLVTFSILSRPKTTGTSYIVVAIDTTSSLLQFHDPRSRNTTLISNIPPPYPTSSSSSSNNPTLQQQKRAVIEQEHRNFVDHTLERHWRGRDVYAPYDGRHNGSPTRGRTDTEYTYGEVTPLGVRQLVHEMGIGRGTTDGGVVFYDLGSGVGRLVVQLYLDHNRRCDCVHGDDDGVEMGCGWTGFDRIVGIEMCDRRHAIATESWRAVRTSLDANPVPEEEEHGAPHRSQPERPAVSFINGDILETDFSDATHLFLSSLCFPTEVTRRISEILLANVARDDGTGGGGSGGRLRVVAALSDLPLLEREGGVVSGGRWIKTTREIQMTWGGSRVRTYRYAENGTHLTTI